MACEFINKSRNLPCANGFSGIKAIGFKERTKLTLTSDDTFEGVGLTSSTPIYRYELYGDGNIYEDDGVSDETAFTTVYTGSLKVTLPILDKETRNQMKLLTYSRPQIFLELFNGTILLAGVENGCKLINSKATTGGARKDMQGWSLEFKSEEKVPFVFVGATGSTLYTSYVNSTNVINPS